MQRTLIKIEIATLFLLLFLPVKASAIIGGEFAKPGQYPFAAYLVMQDKELRDRNLVSECSGSIIASEWILTAAHCVQKSNRINFQASEVFVYVGSVKK